MHCFPGHSASLRSGSNQGCCTSRVAVHRPGWLLVGEGILLGLAADGHAPVSPCSDVLVGYRGAIVVVARIFRYDAWSQVGRAEG